MENKTNVSKKNYYLYVLYNQKSLTPVYIGLSSKLKQRVNRHKKDKIFDSVAVIDSYTSKKEGLTAERCLIKFVSLFPHPQIVNGLYARFSCDFSRELGMSNKLRRIEEGFYEQDKNLKI